MFHHRYRYIFILLLSVYSYVNILITTGDKLFDFKISPYYLFAVLALVVAGSWELNRFADRIINRKARVIHPLILLFGASIINVIVSASVALYLLYAVMGMELPFQFDHWKLLVAFGFRVNLFLNCVNAIVFFMDRLKKIQLEAEQLKKQNVEARLEALRNQINPHFLFNSFNVLSTLVHKDPDASAKFISQLSYVYRYLLYNQENKVVSLRDELSFLDAYTYLLRTRFHDNLIIENTIQNPSAAHMVAPASLQMLIENAIKHNIATKKQPLHIELKLEGNYIEVNNTLQKKAVEEESTKIGLSNITSRYKLLSQLPVIISKTPTHFRVKLPLLQLES